MKRSLLFVTSALMSSSVGLAFASDHLFTARGAGGLTPDKQPFQNGIDNPGRVATTVPGQGSPMSGEDHTTPAVEAGSLLTHHRTELNTNANPGNGVLKEPPPAAAGLTVPRSRMASPGANMGRGH